MRKSISVLLFCLAIAPVGAVTVNAMDSILISGSTTILPLAEAGAEAFNSAQSNYTVAVTGGGTYAGIEDIAKGKSDIAMASNKVVELKEISSGYKFNEIPIGHDGIAIIVSKQIYDAGVTSLTKDQVRKIYTGEINSWKDLGGSDSEILVFAREDGSGTRAVFNECILGRKTATVSSGCVVAESNEEMKQLIVENKTAIGYLGFSYSEDGLVGVIALDGVRPTAETIKSGIYQLTRDLYFYTYGDVEPGVRAFIDFMIGPEGKKIAEAHGFVPL
jgi:phosphate transport system substrate-binding protein